MDSVMLASFADELQKIAGSNMMQTMKPTVGGMGSNVIGKPLTNTGSGFGQSMSTIGGTPKPAKSTNYSMVNSTAPMAASDAGASAKMTPPPPVGT